MRAKLERKGVNYTVIVKAKTLFDNDLKRKEREVMSKALVSAFCILSEELPSEFIDESDDIEVSQVLNDIRHRLDEYETKIEHMRLQFNLLREKKDFETGDQ